MTSKYIIPTVTLATCLSAFIFTGMHHLMAEHVSASDHVLNQAEIQPAPHKTRFIIKDPAQWDLLQEQHLKDLEATMAEIKVQKQPDIKIKNFDADLLTLASLPLAMPQADEIVPEIIPQEDKPTWLKHAVSYDIHPDKPMIAIVIDDMGLNQTQSARALELLPYSVTMAYLPYAKDVTKQVATAQKAGHEIMLHMPMEPHSPTIDPGPYALHDHFNKQQVTANLLHNLERMENFVGINNHMGSKFTENADLLKPVMETLKERELMFLDSRTSPISQAAKVARAHDVPTITRDVFLDHEETNAFVEDAFKKAEAVARRKGSAIAIGHPKAVTIDALAKWIPEAERRGFQFVPMTTVLMKRNPVLKPDVKMISVSR